MLISVPVLSDRLKSKQALSWVPLPNRRQTSATIKQPPPSPNSQDSLSLGSSSPFCSFSLVVQCECSDRHCFHCTLPPHTYTYRITFLSTPTSLPTSHCIPGWTGCCRAECPFAGGVIYKQYMDAVHTPTFHPPTLSHFSSTDTQSPLWGASVCQRTTQQGDGLFFFTLASKECAPSPQECSGDIHVSVRWGYFVNRKENWWDLTCVSGCS